MRIQDTHSLPIMADKHAFIEMSRTVLPLCLQEFEWLAKQKKPLKLELQIFDIYALDQLYPLKAEQLEVRLAKVLEDIFGELRVPYLLFPIVRPDVSKLVFYARVKPWKSKKR